MNQLIDEQLKKIIPTPKQEKNQSETVGHIMELVCRETKNHANVVGVELGGSYAKGTWLPRDTDVDIFVKFKKSVPDELFRSESRNIGLNSMKNYNPTERYADHPYVEADVNGTAVNVVPCYDVARGEWNSAADRSPYHTRHMCENLTDRMKNDVRLFKKFLKVRGIYGAQMAVRGFSGYAAEVLVLNFGGFEEVVRGMASAARGDTIGRTSKKFDTPISIIDPIDENRNLAAAISNRNMALLILWCRALISDPDSAIFGPGVTTAQMGWENVVSVKFPYGGENSEVIWGQAMRAASAITRQMELGGFVIIRHKVLIDDGVICLLFLTESLYIPGRVVRMGPDIFRRAEAANFARSGGLIWVSSDMKLRRMDQRTHHTAGAMLRSILRNPEKAGIPAGLHRYIQEGSSIAVGGRIAQSIKEEAAGLLAADEAVFSAAG